MLICKDIAVNKSVIKSKKIKNILRHQFLLGQIKKVSISIRNTECNTGLTNVQTCLRICTEVHELGTLRIQLVTVVLVNEFFYSF